MGLEYVEIAVQIVVADRYAHARLLRSIRAEGNALLGAIFRKRSVMLVAKEEAGRGIGSHIDICPAVVAEVRSDTGHRVGALGFGDSAFQGYIAKRAVALVPIEVIAGHRQPAWTTVDRDTLEIAVRVGPGLR